MQIDNIVYNEFKGILSIPEEKDVYLNFTKAKEKAQRHIIEYIVNRIGEILMLDPDHSRYYEFDWKLINILNADHNQALKMIKEMAFDELLKYITKNNDDFITFSSILKEIKLLTSDFERRFNEPFKIAKNAPKMDTQLSMFN